MANTLVRVQPRRSNARWGLWIGAIMLLSFTVALVVFANATAKVTVPTLEARAHLRRETNTYLIRKSKNPDRWWLESASPGNPSNLADLIEHERQTLLAILDKYKSASPLAGQVQGRFRELYVTVAKDGYSFQDSKSSDGAPRGTEVCFIPRGQFSKNEPSSLYWDGGWKAVKIAALEWPERLKAGVLFHELGHGLYEGNPKYRPEVSSAPTNGVFTDVSVEEEVIMHELELAVIDKASDGAYLSTLRAIVRKHNAANWRSLLGLVTVEDLHSLDQVIGSENYGLATAQVVCAQNLLALGFCQIETDRALDTEKPAVYRWLRDQGMD